MTAIKESSTIQQNKKYALDLCPVTYVMERIGGFWKPIILYHLSTGDKRYSELKRAIPAVTEKMLIQHLKQLEADGLVTRTAKPIVPPHVVYGLSEGGKGLMPVIRAMSEWAFKDMKENNKSSLCSS
ncbi:winged helix-turn-helix transcriptional regulator [Chryseobacterium potabilaquae]|uniref:Putative HTH-type transcriptional regulator YybR n=1 Tax=Chryseobacterium potabilaquae TaxID=2675057 RepID=A0A6N4X7Z7_9FLAO|nr:helix-turn-helix domain-containing protein [Chryseobacterium potabilaquae]CAA7197139.1 putative HTH-type transcriptional regulator YybR [Chryseobacterium potabilaquae]